MIDLTRFRAKNIKAARQVGTASSKKNHFGCPIPWLLRVLPVVKSKKQLVVAIYVWRQHVIRGYRKTFDMPNGELKRWKISRWTKYRTLVMLETAGIIAMKQIGKETFEITILP
jgi:hypothetical protein